MTEALDRPPLAVLLVVDQRQGASDLRVALGLLGHDAFATAASPQEALARAAERRPDLVVIDIRSSDGIETAAALRARFDVPVIQLRKPVKAEELSRAIEVGVVRHALERQLRHRDHWFATTLQSISDGVVATDAAGQVTFMNQAAEALCGVGAAEGVGQPAHEVLQLADAGFAPGDGPVGAVLRDRVPAASGEGKLLDRKRGVACQVSHRASPVVDGAELLGAVVVLREVTGERRLQQKVELVDRLASLGTLAGGVAHEINNPLAVVGASSRFLSEEWTRHFADHHASAPRDGEIDAAFEDVQAATVRIAGIVAGLQGFSSAGAHATEALDLARCAEWAVRTSTHAFDDRARLLASFGAVPAVHGDVARVGQVLINLLSNASQAIAPGDPGHNQVQVATFADARGWAVVEVRDTGKGIAGKDLLRVFEPFFTTQATGQGTGLGLSVCHGIVTSLGGEITVESELGKGSIFRVAFPPMPGAGTRPPAPAKAEALPGVAPGERPAQERVGRILVVDDEETNLRSIARSLRGHEVVCLESAEAALELLARGGRFDVILTDLMMPGMTGMELYREVLAKHPPLAARMAFISGGATSERALAFLEALPNRSIGKPFAVPALRALVQEVMGSAGPGEPRS